MQATLRLLILTVGTFGFLFAGSTFMRACGTARVYEKKEHALLNSNFILIAINGGSAENDQNTFEAFDRAALAGAWIHIPLRLTQDNKLVAVQDATLDRTTNGKGFVREHTLDDIKALDVGGSTGRKVPSFDEIIRRYHKTPIWAELLDNSLPAAVDIAGKVQLHSKQDTFVFSSPQMPPLAEVRRIKPEWMTASPVDEAERLAMLSSLNLQSVGSIKGDFLIAPLRRENISILTPELVAEAHKRFKKVIAWNVNNETDAQLALEMKVDGIATEKPELLRGIIGTRH